MIAITYAKGFGIHLQRCDRCGSIDDGAKYTYGISPWRRQAPGTKLGYLKNGMTQSGYRYYSFFDPETGDELLKRELVYHNTVGNDRWWREVILEEAHPQNIVNGLQPEKGKKRCTDCFDIVCMKHWVTEPCGDIYCSCSKYITNNKFISEAQVDGGVLNEINV